MACHESIISARMILDRHDHHHIINTIQIQTCAKVVLWFCVVVLCWVLLCCSVVVFCIVVLLVRYCGECWLHNIVHIHSLLAT